MAGRARAGLPLDAIITASYNHAMSSHGSSSSTLFDVTVAAATWRRVLVVAPGYMASPTSRNPGGVAQPFRTLGGLWRALTREPYRCHVRFYRDFYANPRSGAYMAARLDELFAQHCPGAKAIVLAAPGALGDGVSGSWAEEVRTLPAGGEPIQLVPEFARHALKAMGDEAFDAVLILHPDAIGLGQEPLERALESILPGHLFALSGRRRLRHLDAAQLRRFRLRRFVAETRVYEAWLVFCYWLGIHLFADRVSGGGTAGKGRP
jgi:hypothetical protein